MGSGTGSTAPCGSAFCVVKYAFFIFNIIVWLLGCGILTMGVWMQVNKGPVISLLPANSFLSASALCISIGALIFVVGFCGCCGALMENQCLLIVYFVLVFVIFGLEVVALVLGFSNRAEMKKMINEELLLSIQYSYNPAIADGPEEAVVYVVDKLQTDLECCGVNNYTDWYKIQAWPSKDQVPVSCCVTKTDSCHLGSKKNWYDQGCMREVEYWFTSNMYVMGVSALTVGVFQILAMVASITLFCCLRNEKYLL